MSDSWFRRRIIRLDGSCNSHHGIKTVYLPKRLGDGLFDQRSQFWNLELRAITFGVLMMD